MKTCTRCGKTQPTSEFYTHQNTSDGLRPACKECTKKSLAVYRDTHREEIRAQQRKHKRKQPYVYRPRANRPGRSGTSYAEMRAKWPERVREWNRRGEIRKHGIQPEEYDALLAEQGGVCAACGGTHTHKRLFIDHDHDHCPGAHGCRGCVRGILCQSCNAREERGDPVAWAAYVSRPRPFAAMERSP